MSLNYLISSALKTLLHLDSAKAQVKAYQTTSNKLLITSYSCDRTSLIGFIFGV
jgi:hypothetical protein